MDREEILCLIRQTFKDNQARTREELLRELAASLGYKRIGPRIRKALLNDIRTAVIRGIVVNEGGSLSVPTHDPREYEKESLKEVFEAAIGRTWIDRDEAIRAFARYIGFSRVGKIIKETGNSVIRGLLRQKRIEKDNSNRIRRC